MPRSALIALSALLFVAACQTTAADAQPVGSPSGSVAGTEAKPGGATTSEPTSTRDPGGSGLARSLVAVSSVNASEAGPCERMCGSLGDCLFRDEAYADASAGGLELECLDMCVHSPEHDRARDEFLACGSKTECGELQACAERTWDGLAQVRRSPEIAGIVVAMDPCKSGCRWFYSCMYTGMPPGEAYVDEQVQTGISACVNECDSYSTEQRDTMAKFAACLPDHCSFERVGECWEYIY